MLTVVFFISSLLFASSASAVTTLRNISAWGFMSNQVPHVACFIISGSSTERFVSAVYVEANRSINSNTNPKFYIGRLGAGNPLTNPENYFLNDNWSAADADVLISAVGRVPNHVLDAGTIISGPAGPTCIYAYESSATETDLGYVNIQFNHLGDATSESRSKGGDAGTSIRALSREEMLELLDYQADSPKAKIPAHSDSAVLPLVPESLNKLLNKTK